MKKTVLAVISGVLVLGSGTAFAQDSQRNLPPRPLRASQQPQAQAAPAAPVGHRQPRAGDVPPETGDNDPAKMDAQDRELDRMIKGICKGC